MKKELKDLWVAALRDPKYVGKEGWLNLHQRSQNGTERFNVWGVLYAVLKEYPDYQAAFAGRVQEQREIMRLPAADPQRVVINALVLKLAVDNAPPAQHSLPASLEEYAGLQAVSLAAQQELIALNKQEVHFSVLADKIAAEF